MSLKQSGTLRGRGSVSPLLSIFSQFISVARLPSFEIHSSICRLVIAIACAAVEMTADSSQRSDMTSSRKITDNEGNCTTSKPSIRITGGVGELETAFPCVYQIIDEWSDVVVEIIQRWLLRTWDDAREIHVLGFISNIQR
jgi:hypothetical protein